MMSITLLKFLLIKLIKSCATSSLVSLLTAGGMAHLKQANILVSPEVVKAALSTFTGSKIETLFSMMNDMIDKRSSRMDVATCSVVP